MQASYAGRPAHAISCSGVGNLRTFYLFLPHIVKLTILVADPIGSPLLLLRSKRAKLFDVVLLLLPADKPGWIYFFGRFSGMKKAALEKFVPKCDIFFFFFKVHQVGGTMGAAL